MSRFKGKDRIFDCMLVKVAMAESLAEARFVTMVPCPLSWYACYTVSALWELASAKEDFFFLDVTANKFPPEMAALFFCFWLPL